MTIMDSILTELHKEFGHCGHCGKKECAGKITNSRLPSMLDTDVTLKIIEKIVSDAPIQVLK